MAKNQLMDGHDSSDSEKEATDRKIKLEPCEDTKFTPDSKSERSPLNKKAATHQESLVLTADKMMKKELNLLHAPVVLDQAPVMIPVKDKTTDKFLKVPFFSCFCDLNIFIIEPHRLHVHM